MNHYSLFLLLSFGILNIYSNTNVRSINNHTGFNITGFTESKKWQTLVSSAGDVNGDGYDDVIIGASTYSQSTVIAYVIFGGPTISLTDIDVESMNINQGFSIIFEPHTNGPFVSSAGDINGDGFSDVILGTPAPVFNEHEKGSVYVIFGGSTTSLSNINVTSMTSKQGFKISGDHQDFGHSVSSSSDLNGDAYGDLIFGLFTDEEVKGIIYIIFGGPSLTSFNVSSMTSDQGFTIHGESPNTFLLQNTLSSAGDVNGDSYGDLIIGGGFNGNHGSAAYVIYGGPELSSIHMKNFNNSQGFKIAIPDLSDSSAWTVNSAGDINGDGYADVLLATTFTGSVYVIFGGASHSDINVNTMNNSQGFTIGKGDYWAADFGKRAASAGDINGDGFDDLIVGAPYDLFHSPGYAYIFYGGVTSSLSSFNISNMTSSQGFILEGECCKSDFGWSVNSAGDVNNDGYADVIIGFHVQNSDAPYPVHHHHVPKIVHVHFGGPNVSSHKLMAE